MFQIHGYNSRESVNLLDCLSKTVPCQKFVRLLKARNLTNHYFVIGKNPFDVARERLTNTIEDLNELESILKPCLRHKSDNNQ